MYIIYESRADVTAYDSSGPLGARDENTLGLLSLWRSRNSISQNFGVSGTLDRGYCYNPTGESLPDVQTRSETRLVREERQSNPRFKERIGLGEVVVSPYLVDRITVIEVQTLIPGPGKYIGSVDEQDKDGSSEGEYIFQKDFPIQYSPCPHFGGRMMPTNGAGEWYKINIVYKFTDSASVEWPAPLDVDALTTPFINAEMNVPFLQGLVAEAYTKAVDALTALAEGPETVGYIYNILRNAGSLVFNHKRVIKELKETYKHRAELIKRASEIRMLSIMGSHPRTQRAISRQNREITRARRDLVRDLKSNGINSTSALASAWLQFRYAIMPNVYLVRDIIKAEERLGLERVSSSDTLSQTLTPTLKSGYTVSGSRIRLHKAWCQLSLRVDSPLSRLRSTTSFDILVTAWELVPLSFVCDWFVNVGDALSVLTPPSDAKSVGITYSFKDISNVTYTAINGSKTTIIRESYMRQVTSTEDFSGLHSNVQLNWKRALDSGALLWSLVLKRKLRY